MWPRTLSTLSLRSFLVFGALALAFATAPRVFSHPVPKNSYDRFITVRLQKSAAGGGLRLRVDYRLEVDETTVVSEDMKPFRDEVDILKYRGRILEYYGEFTRLYAPILADNLLLKINGKRVLLECQERAQKLHDDKGEPLGHLRCDFTFVSELPAPVTPEIKLSFKELNYQFYEGKIVISTVNEAGVDLVSRAEPTEELQKKPATEFRPGEADALRTVVWRFKTPEALLAKATTAKDAAPPADAAATVAKEQAPPKEPTARAEAAAVRTPSKHDESILFRLFFHESYGFVVLLVLFTVFGAIHALTPGHGKTLVAAYLVGERGTVGHAIFLGLVTTLTHTGAVLVVATAMFFSRDLGLWFQRSISGLSLVMGLVMICLAFYLLLLRLSGRADHIHLGGGHHHHHHGGHHHHHAPAADNVGGDAEQRVTFWSLVLVGILGGLVPCWDAIFLLLFTIGTSAFWQALPLLTAFSAGLAGTLVAVGVLVVKSRQFAVSRWGEGRVVRSLPIISSLLVIALGFLLCYEAVQGG